MAKKLHPRLRTTLRCICGVIAIIATAWFVNFFLTLRTEEIRDNHQKYPIVTAIVSKVGSIQSGVKGKAFRESALSFTYRGVSVAITRRMPFTEQPGNHEPLVVGPEGRIYVYHDVTNFEKNKNYEELHKDENVPPFNPRDIDTGGYIVGAALSFLIGGVIGFALWLALARLAVAIGVGIHPAPPSDDEGPGSAGTSQGEQSDDDASGDADGGINEEVDAAAA